MQHLDLLLMLVLILVAARLAGVLSRKIGMPAVLGELLAGLVLGPSLLGWVTTSPVLDTVADIGVLLLMFIAGLETDLLQMRRVGKASLLTALGGMLLPFAGGMAIGAAMGLGHAATLFLAAALTATSVSVSVQVLNEVKQLRSKPGMIIMGAAIIDDILGILVLTLVLGFSGGSNNPVASLLRVGIFFPVAILAGNLALKPMMDWITRNHVREAGIALVLAIVLFYAWTAEALGGVAAITGAYLAGVLIGRLPQAEEVGSSIATIGQGLFIPVFFVTVGLRTNMQDALIAPAFALLLTAIAIASKAIGASLGARLGKCSWGESYTVGAGMIARGEVALVVASLGLNSGLLDATTFAVVIVMAVATTLLTPMLLKLTFKPVEVGEAETPGASPMLVPVIVEADNAR